MCAVEDEDRGAILLLRGSGAPLCGSANLQGAMYGLELYLQRVGVQAKQVVNEAKVVQEVVGTTLFTVSWFPKIYVARLSYLSLLFLACPLIHQINTNSPSFYWPQPFFML